MKPLIVILKPPFCAHRSRRRQLRRPYSRLEQAVPEEEHTKRGICGFGVGRLGKVSTVYLRYLFRCKDSSEKAELEGSLLAVRC